MTNILVENNHKLDYKLDYISKLFEKSSKKRIENYVITRIWHKLSDSTIKFIPQQYVKRDNEKYALTDLYLPQIDLHIEINEVYHYKDQDKVEIDIKRKLEIENKTNHKLIEIDCSKSLDEIHQAIDKIVKDIEKRVEEQKENKTFLNWENDIEFTPKYHKDKGYLKLSETPCLRKIDEICELFDVKVPMRGFLRKGGVKHKEDKNLMIWWPNENNKLWSNYLSEDGKTIHESHNNHEIRVKHVRAVLKDNNKRVAFFRHTDVLGFTFYRFKGVYEIDIEKTKPEHGIIWKRIADYIEV